MGLPDIARPAVRKSPDWTRDELILACDLVWTNSWHELRAEYSQVVELSQLLQRHQAHPLDRRPATFRNPNSVGRKTTDIATRHPDYRGTPTRGNRLDREVLVEFMAAPDEMHRQALALRAAILAGEADPSSVDDVPADLDLDDSSAHEGGLLERLHLRRERDRGIRDRAVKSHKRKHGRVACAACGFDFGAAYGTRGEDYIECHHKVPLSESGATTTKVADFVLLCSNCHRMIHRRRPWLSFDDLVELVTVNRLPAG